MASSSPLPVPGAQGSAEQDDSPPASPYVTSTSPPCVPHLPPSSPQDPPSTSILLNPLPPKSPSSPASDKGSFFGAPFRRVVSGSAAPPLRAAATDANALAGPAPRSPTSPRSPPLPTSPSQKRRPSIVVEVVHSPPPAHFFADMRGDDEEVSSLSSFSTSPPRIPHGLRSRSVSPAASPSSPHFHHHSPPLHDPSASGSSLLSGSSEEKANGSIKFAPLPPGRRAHRSNSLSIGVASRAKMIQAQGGTPDARGARYAGPLQWYEGGDLPPEVYTWRDAHAGLKKLFGKMKSSPSSSSLNSNATTTTTMTDERGRPRSNSIVSNTSDSGGSEAEARRMEREAKGKGVIEHIEEAEEEEDDQPGHYEDVPATVDDGYEDDGEEEEGEGTEGTGTEDDDEPKTPPDQAGGVLSEQVGVDDDLEVERRRARKGKGKAVVHSEHAAPPSSGRGGKVAI
ncbi:hypothetical protein JCM6882_008789 [Rhodosporidiobolus microsporus]